MCLNARHAWRRSIAANPSTIRMCRNPELAELLRARLDAEDEIFASNDVFYLTKMNGPQIHRMLARMIDYLETRSGMPSHYTNYVTRSGKHAHEIEHIWANHPERHEDDFDHPTDFAGYRNRIGGLLLLLKSFNASYGDLPYEKKHDHYYGQNILAKTLHDTCYEHHPGFLRFVKESGLAFKPHPQFKRADLDERQVLYQKLAELIWNPHRLKQAAAS